MTDVGRHEAKPSLVPTRKVASGALGGAVATIILWIIDVAGVDVPQAVAGAITTVVAIAIAYLVPSA
jgi:putative flippase GtrA